MRSNKSPLIDLWHPEMTGKNLRAVFMMGVIYFVIGAGVSWFLRQLCESLPRGDDLDDLDYISVPGDRGLFSKRGMLLGLEILFMVGLVCMAVFVVRLYVAQISQRYIGLDLPEVKGGVILAFSFLAFVGPCIKSKLERLVNSTYE